MVFYQDITAVAVACVPVDLFFPPTSADAHWGGYMKIKHMYSNLELFCATVTSNTSSSGQDKSFIQLRDLLTAVTVV